MKKRQIVIITAFLISMILLLTSCNIMQGVYVLSYFLSNDTKEKVEALRVERSQDVYDMYTKYKDSLHEIMNSLSEYSEYTYHIRKDYSGIHYGSIPSGYVYVNKYKSWDYSGQITTRLEDMEDFSLEQRVILNELYKKTEITRGGIYIDATSVTVVIENRDFAIVELCYSPGRVPSPVSTGYEHVELIENDWYLAIGCYPKN